MDREVAIKIFNEVRRNYDLIAEDFSRTRKSVWEEFRPLAEYASAGDKILDLGCGNGRLSELFLDKKIEYVGIDNAARLIEIARQKYPANNFQLCDGLKIPFSDGSFDKIYCVAVLHHIPGALRREFLDEARRVLKPGGKLIVTVWYLWQKNTYWPAFIKFTLKKLIGKSPLDFFDSIEPWFGEKAERYLHNFRKKEFQSLIKQTGFEIEKFFVLERGPKNKNLAIIARK